MNDAQKYELVMTERDGTFYVLCKWDNSNQDIDNLYESKKEADCALVFEQLREKLGEQYYSHNEIRRIMDQMPKLSIMSALSRYAPAYSGRVLNY
jgi:hypothetical protein